jgi:diketogulonate reductase-like aldo/keto reductase
MTAPGAAEMYGDGGAEGSSRRNQGRRDDLFVVSKVYRTAGRKARQCLRAQPATPGTVTSNSTSALARKRPPAETVDAFERLRTAGKIRRWGVSNFDTSDMRELFALPEGRHCATNQVLYHLGERGIEWELLPWLSERQIPVMAYSPLGRGGLLRRPKLAALAKRAGATPAQLALRWLLRTPDVIAIPESTNLDHIRANRAAPGNAPRRRAPQEIARRSPPSDPPARHALIWHGWSLGVADPSGRSQRTEETFSSAIPLL